jgi:trimeric autotransporter adhesin
MKRLLAICLMCCIYLSSWAQNVAINSDGSAAIASALLDVKSTDKGMLVPRMSATQRVAIAAPVNGLLVYDMDSLAFSYFDGLVWIFLKGNNSISGQWNLKGNAGTTAANFIGTTDAQDLRFKVNGEWFGFLGSTNKNIFWGENSGISNTTGTKNISIGTGAGAGNLDRSNLVAIGDSALYNNGVGATVFNQATENTAVGSKSLFTNTVGNSNTATGIGSLQSNSVGSFNTAMGNYALSSNNSNSNTGIGSYALNSNTTGYLNTTLGAFSDVLSTNLNNATAIGAGAKVAANNTMVLGGTGADAVNVAIGATATNAYGHGGINRILEIRNDNGILGTTNLQSHVILSTNGSAGSLGGITWAGTNVTAADKRTGFIGNLYEAGSTNASPSASMPFYTTNAGSLSEKMRITNAGDVGIGITNPGYKLHVGNATNAARIEGPVTAGGTALSIGGNGDVVVDKPGTVGGRFMILDNGNVGINNPNPTQQLDISGKIKIADGSQGAGRVLTSDASGVGTWVTNTGVTPAVFGSFGVGVPLDNSGNFYTTANITLPPGKWIINATYLMTPSFITPLSAGQGIWVRTYFTDGAAIATETTNIVAGSSSLISGSLNFPSLYGTVNGQVMIHNNTGANKTYHVWASMELMGTTSSTFKLDSFNGVWGENQLTAIPMN